MKKKEDKKDKTLNYIIIGTILALNNKQIDLSYIEERLNGKYKTTLYNAPSQGLYLVEVFYD